MTFTEERLSITAKDSEAIKEKIVAFNSLKVPKNLYDKWKL